MSILVTDVRPDDTNRRGRGGRRVKDEKDTAKSIAECGHESDHMADFRFIVEFCCIAFSSASSASSAVRVDFSGDSNV
jgi:hypothetical protein